MTTQLSTTGKCPRCEASWDAGPIPEKYLSSYGGETRYSRLVLVKMQGIDSDSDHWRCPDCSATFNRVMIQVGQ